MTTDTGKAPGFCKCGDHHAHYADATWCYVCEKPLLPVDMRPAIQRQPRPNRGTGTGWPEPVKLLGCTCMPVAGSHRPGCPWAAR